VEVLDGAREPVQLIDDDIVDVPLPEIQEQALELRPVQAGCREGGIFVGAEMVPPLRLDLVEATFLVGDQRIEVGALNLILGADSIVDDRVVPSLGHGLFPPLPATVCPSRVSTILQAMAHISRSRVSPTRDVPRRVSDNPRVADVVGSVRSVYPAGRNPTGALTTSTTAKSDQRLFH
jgi:hypothetical protein